MGGDTCQNKKNESIDSIGAPNKESFRFVQTIGSATLCFKHLECILHVLGLLSK